MAFIKNHAPASKFHTKYKRTFRICKQICDNAFDGQDSVGIIRHVFIQHLQLLHPAEHVLMHLPEMPSFGRKTRYINLPNLIPNPHTPVKCRE